MSSLQVKPVVQNVDYILLLNKAKKIAKRIDDRGLKDCSIKEVEDVIDRYPQGRSMFLVSNSYVAYASNIGRVLVFNQNQGKATLFDLSSNGSFSCSGFSNSQLLTLDLLRQWQINDNSVHEFSIKNENGNKILVYLNENEFV